MPGSNGFYRFAHEVSLSEVGDMIMHRWTLACCLLGIGVVLTATKSAPAQLVGLWEFEDPGNLGKATVGADLTVVGGSAAAGSGGPDTGGVSLDVNQRLEIANPIGGNGGGSKTNIYSVLVDFKQVPGSWQAVLDTTNSSDGEADIFINGSDLIGISGDYGGAPFTSDEWHRMVMVFDLTSSDELIVYQNGNLAQIVAPVSTIDERWSLDSMFALFSDGQNGGEERLTQVSNVALFSSALSADQAVALGGAGRPIPEPNSLLLLSIGGLLVAARRRSAA
jgi:hypothetical protein